MATTTTVQEEELYSPEFDYQKAMDEYKVGQKPILDAIMSNYKKPEPEIDPEQAKKAKFGAALTDTFGSLAEMFAHGQGALVGKRETPSSTQTTNARLQALKDKYDNDMLQYGATKSNAELQDLNMYLSARREADGKKRSYSLYKAKAAQEAEKEAERKRQFDIKQKEDARHNRAMENKPTGNDNNKDPKTVPVFLNNQQYNFPAEDVDAVVALAIKHGKAGSLNIKDSTGRLTSVPITSTTNLSPAQKTQIFNAVYKDYIKERLPDGRFTIRQEPINKPYQPKPGEFKENGIWKVKKPKQAAQPTVKQSNFSLNGVKSR